MRNWERAAISQVDFWWNKSLLWDSGESSEQFYGNSRERGANKHSAVKYLTPLLLNLKVWKMLSSKKKIKKLWSKKESDQIGGRIRSVSLKNLVIWNQKYNKNP